LGSNKVQVEIRVTDFGIGINEQDQKNLFKSYFKTTDQTSKFLNSKSHGLGLSICRNIAHALNGSMSVENLLGNGATFIFTFIAEKSLK
jgi:signal transduction histidine kinase